MIVQLYPKLPHCKASAGSPKSGENFGRMLTRVFAPFLIHRRTILADSGGTVIDMVKGPGAVALRDEDGPTNKRRSGRRRKKRRGRWFAGKQYAIIDIDDIHFLVLTLALYFCFIYQNEFGRGRKWKRKVGFLSLIKRELECWTTLLDVSRFVGGSCPSFAFKIGLAVRAHIPKWPF